jgi:hypothetical protein
MSRSNSSQQSSVSNTNINNVLDGGAIKQAFDFAEKSSEEAFDTAQKSTDSAISANKDITKAALTINKDVSQSALKSNQDVVNEALNKLQEQNNRSMDALAGLQGKETSNNFELLKGIQNTINTSNTGGASGVLDNQKWALLAVLVGWIGYLLIRKGA